MAKTLAHSLQTVNRLIFFLSHSHKHWSKTGDDSAFDLKPRAGYGTLESKNGSFELEVRSKAVAEADLDGREL